MKLSNVCDIFLDGQLAGKYKIKSVLISDINKNNKMLFVELNVIKPKPIEHIEVTYSINKL